MLKKRELVKERGAEHISVRSIHQAQVSAFSLQTQGFEGVLPRRRRWQSSVMVDV